MIQVQARTISTCEGKEACISTRTVSVGWAVREGCATDRFDASVDERRDELTTERLPKPVGVAALMRCATALFFLT